MKKKKMIKLTKYILIGIINLVLLLSLEAQHCLHTTSTEGVQKMEGNSENRSSSCQTPRVLPVAIHFSGSITGYGNSTEDSLCLVQSIGRQIEQLNKDFGGYNPEVENYCQLIQDGCSYDPIALANGTCIQFVIGTKNHPEVSISNTNSRLLKDGEYAVTFGKHIIEAFNCTGSGNNLDCDEEDLFDIVNSEWEGYLNIYVSDVAPINGPLDASGESTIFGAADLASGQSANGSGVFIMAHSFGGEGIQCPTGGTVLNSRQTLGRTTTHEIGHHFGLMHTFQRVNQQGGPLNCNTDHDGISDTPVQKFASDSDYDYLDHECGEHPGFQDECNDVFWFNFMDYSKDDQMFMFSLGQSSMMNTVLDQAFFVGNVPYLDHTLVSDQTINYSPILPSGCNITPVASIGPCFGILYADYSYECGGQDLVLTVGSQWNYNGRFCGSNNPSNNGSGSGGFGGGGGGGGPGGPGGGGVSTVGTTSTVPVVNENDECQECTKEIQRRIEILRNMENQGGN